ncbi:MAG: hypothetical protein ACP5K7_12940 [Verrucomicrobiia bacterium]
MNTEKINKDGNDCDVVRRRRFVPSELRLERSPSLWDLIRCQEYLKDCASKGTISNVSACLCVISGLFKSAFRCRYGTFKASFEQLADDSGLSRATVVKKLLELEKVGIIKIKHCGVQRKPNIYTLFVMTDADEGRNATTDNVTALKGAPTYMNQPIPQGGNLEISNNRTNNPIRPENASNYTTPCSQLYQHSITKRTDYNGADNSLCLQRDSYNNISEKDFYISNDKVETEVINNSKKFPSGNINNRNTNVQCSRSTQSQNAAGFSGVDDSRDQRTIMVKINLLNKRLEEIKTKMSNLKPDTDYPSEKDKKRYYELNNQKADLIERLNELYDLAGLGILKLQVPKRYQTTEESQATPSNQSLNGQSNRQT